MLLLPPVLLASVLHWGRAWRRRRTAVDSEPRKTSRFGCPAPQSAIILEQLGPPPLAAASVGIHLQYALLERLRRRSHIVDSCIALVDGAAALAVKAIVCWMLTAGVADGSQVPYRAVFAPFWCAPGCLPTVLCICSQLGLCSIVRHVLLWYTMVAWPWAREQEDSVQLPRSLPSVFVPAVSDCG